MVKLNSVFDRSMSKFLQLNNGGRGVEAEGGEGGAGG